MSRLAHIVNPVLVDESSDLAVAQPITFETMRVARRFAGDQLHVDLFTAQYFEDRLVLPSGFVVTPDLDRSVLDCAPFEKQRKLPLIGDILSRLYQATDAEFLIYTNVDIGLLPHFYVAVDRLIAAGYDAFVINRRTISNRYTRIDQIPLMYAQVGLPHRGWDCFVFRRDAYPRYELGSVCVGAPRVGLALIANLMAQARHFHEFTDEHLTFHLGNDRAWGRTGYSDYAAHNQKQTYQVIDALECEGTRFSRSTPPGRFMFYQRNPLLRAIYESYVRFHVPLHLVRPMKQAVRRLGGQK